MLEPRSGIDQVGVDQGVPVGLGDPAVQREQLLIAEGVAATVTEGRVVLGIGLAAQFALYDVRSSHSDWLLPGSAELGLLRGRASPASAVTGDRLSRVFMDTSPSHGSGPASRARRNPRRSHRPASCARPHERTLRWASGSEAPRQVGRCPRQYSARFKCPSQILPVSFRFTQRHPERGPVSPAQQSGCVRNIGRLEICQARTCADRVVLVSHDLRGLPQRRPRLTHPGNPSQDPLCPRPTHRDGGTTLGLPSTPWTTTPTPSSSLRSMFPPGQRSRCNRGQTDHCPTPVTWRGRFATPLGAEHRVWSCDGDAGA